MNEKKYILEQISEEEKLKQELTNRMPTVVKVLDSLVFDKLDINYSLKLLRTGNAPGYYLDINYDIEVDRLNSSLPVYDKAYEDVMYSMSDRISAALVYVGLQSYFSTPLLSYIDDDETYIQRDELQEALYDEIQKEYPNVPLERIKEADLYYYLYKADDDNPYIRVEAGGMEVTMEPTKTHPYETLIDCDELWDIMSKVYENHPIGKAFDLENYLCL